MPVHVLLDANVLIQAPLRDTILRAAESTVVRVRWSRRILDEVQHNLVEARLTDERRAARLIQTLHLAFPDALVAGFEARIPSMTNHPNDRHVLAAAVHAQVDALVTLNLADFPAGAVSGYGLQIVSPDSLLSDLLNHSQEAMLEIIAQQARDLIAPPITVEDVIAELEQSAPRFGNHLRTHDWSQHVAKPID